ncbi:MAG: cytochrome-c peroxidase [Nitrospinota bacterium]
MKNFILCFSFLTLSFLLPQTLLASEDLSSFDPLPVMTFPADNLYSVEKEMLGKMLFFDPRLSGSNWIRCATCHDPALGFSDALPRSIGDGQKELGRHSPTVINTGYNLSQFWDGRAKTLEEQALGPIQAAGEMNQNIDNLIKELNAIPEYRRLFKKIFPEEGVSASTIGKALATFERTIISANSPFDRYLAGNKTAMSRSAINGMNLFAGKAGCNLCHNGPNFTDNKFHNIGVEPGGPLQKDSGRFAVTKEVDDTGAFKTPTLRHITRTAPYMHNGTEKTLSDVVEFYNLGGKSKENLSPLIQPLSLTEKEKDELVEFLKALEGEPIAVSIPILP